MRLTTVILMTHCPQHLTNVCSLRKVAIIQPNKISSTDYNVVQIDYNTINWLSEHHNVTIIARPVQHGRLCLVSQR